MIHKFIIDRQNMSVSFYHHRFFFVGCITLGISALVACSTPKHATPTQPHTQAPLIISPVSAVAPTVTPISITPQPTTPQPTRIVVTPATTQPNSTPTHSVTQPARHYATFNEWKQDFIQRAITQGYSASIINNLMTSANLDNSVIALDKKQAEFTKMPWEYLDSAVSTTRISQGKSKLNSHASLLDSIQHRYGVPKHIVVAIWGMESSYGAGTGTTNLINALSSLAFDGRRREFAESQLLSMATMIQQGDVSPSQLTGSWAGGMGHTQFIPSTWLSQGIDGNHDGKKSPWVIADALSSTANYLANSGWIDGLDAFYEVRLPTNFNYALIGQSHSLDDWRNFGLTYVTGSQLNGTAHAQLWLPAGIHGPALLTTKNFEVIKVYNNSTSYALAVALLGKRLKGESNIVTGWPRHERPLSRQQILTLQQTLTQRGYDTQGIDGVAGANTRRAFARWQADNGKIADGFISQNSAQSLIW